MDAEVVDDPCIVLIMASLAMSLDFCWYLYRTPMANQTVTPNDHLTHSVTFTKTISICKEQGSSFTLRLAQTIGTSTACFALTLGSLGRKYLII